MQVRVVIFGMEIDDSVLYRGTEHQSSDCSSLYLFDCLSFLTLNRRVAVTSASKNGTILVPFFDEDVTATFLFRKKCSYLEYGFTMFFLCEGLRTSFIWVILPVFI